ncbi:DUF4143 domain-containing protein [Nonomuraea sp. NBC_00507]|uniref:DUF4143 domain-containing protein n=1 Tax=Nonomuraea sp. NBC_00507 TaxID=2976002 RepID=UPI003FA6124C
MAPEGLGARVAPARGALVETFIVNELAKRATRSPFRVNLFHRRLSQGAEVDLVVERTNGRVMLPPAKSTWQGAAVACPMCGCRIIIRARYGPSGSGSLL